MYKFPIPYEEDEDEDGVEGILTVEGNEEDEGDILEDKEEEEDDEDDNDEDGVDGILTVEGNDGDFDEGVLYKFPIP